MQHKILIIEDGTLISQRIKEVPSLKAYKILYADSIECASTLMAEDEIDVIVSDETISGTSGMEFLATARQKCPNAIQMIMTGENNFKSAMRAINEGEIYRLFSKPCNVVDMALTIHCVLHKKNHLKRMVNAGLKEKSGNMHTSTILDNPAFALQNP